MSNADLLNKYSPTGPERGGLIQSDGSILELENIAENPEHGFAADSMSLIEHLDDAIGTWHTHPGQTANLSSEDWEAFIQFEHFKHAIVGSDGVRWYETKGLAVINVS